MATTHAGKTVGMSAQGKWSVRVEDTDIVLKCGDITAYYTPGEDCVDLFDGLFGFFHICDLKGMARSLTELQRTIETHGTVVV